MEAIAVLVVGGLCGISPAIAFAFKPLADVVIPLEGTGGIILLGIKGLPESVGRGWDNKRAKNIHDGTTGDGLQQSVCGSLERIGAILKLHAGDDVLLEHALALAKLIITRGLTNRELLGSGTIARTGPVSSEGGLVSLDIQLVLVGELLGVGAICDNVGPLRTVGLAHTFTDGAATAAIGAAILSCHFFNYNENPFKTSKPLFCLSLSRKNRLRIIFQKGNNTI